LQDTKGDEFKKMLDEHDELFDQVQRAREGVLDAQNIVELTKVPLSQIDLLANATKRLVGHP